MKSPIILFFTLFLPLGLGAQIVLTQANVPAVGDTLFYARDTTVLTTVIGSAGPNQVWDFSELEVEENFQLIATEAALDTESINYPGANLIITSEQVKTFIQSSDTAVYIMGGGVPEAAAFGLEVVNFEPPQKVYQFPIEYGSSYSNFYKVEATVAGELVFPSVDSVRVIRRANANIEVDGYGTLKTPFNSYEALRQKTETINYDSIYIYFLGNWVPFLSDTTQTVEYQWLTAEAKGNTLSTVLDIGSGNLRGIEFFIGVENSSAPTTAFSFSDQSEGVFSFTDQSGNLPTSWQWTFGDGGSSTEQNPVYTYTVGGDYQVCLTATNTVGSNQSCQSITVDVLNNIPNLRNRTAVKVYPNPADQTVLIKTDHTDQTLFTLSLFNQQGQKILQQQFRGSTQLNTSKLPVGLYSYFLNAVENKKWSSGKISIVH